MFVADRTIRYGNSNWDALQAQNLVKGKVITIGDKQYLCRLMTGGNSNPASVSGGEWSDLIVAFTPNTADSHWSYSDPVNSAHPYGGYTWCQEIASTNIYERVLRGSAAVNGFSVVASNVVAGSNAYGWRPVLELL